MSTTILEDKMVKARKNHVCYLCGLTIPKGIKYNRRSGVFDDGFWTAKMHEQCELLTKGWDEEDWEAHDAWEFREHIPAEIFAELVAQDSPLLSTDSSK